MSKNTPQSIIWMHEDALSFHHPVFQIAGETRHKIRAVFVWDSAYFARQDYSLKRLTFIYECLIDLQSQQDIANSDMQFEVFSGDTQTVLAGLINIENDVRAQLKAPSAADLYLADTPNPTFLDIANGLTQAATVEIIPNVPFIDTPDNVDMTRFFRFWNRSRRSALGFSTPS